MPFLTKADFKTHLYAEIIEEISRADDDVVNRAIASAIAETKAYMSRFDLIALFGDTATDPTFISDHLQNIVKDIAAWHLVKLANPNVNMELFRTMYKDAIDFLKAVMMGKADPGWPYKPDDPTTPANENNFVQYSSNPKRTQHF